MDERAGKLYEAAWLHHEKGLTQKEVAGKLGVDKATISRWMQEALMRGIVAVAVRPPGLEELQVQLQQAFGLKRARVIPPIPGLPGFEDASDAPDVQNEELGKAAAAFVGPALQGGIGVGLGGGRAVAAFARHLFHHCPMVGLKFFALAVSSREPFPICATSLTAICTSLIMSEFQRRADRKVPPSTTPPPAVDGHALRLPGKGGDFAALAKAADSYYDAAMKEVELVVTGIGAIETCWVLEDSERADLKCKMGAVGDILYDIYGEAGTPIKVKAAAAVFPFAIDRLRRMVADGKEVMVITTGKVAATYHALASKQDPFVTGIVTDEGTARGVLELQGSASP